MMSASRIDRTFARLHDQHRGGMVTYVTAGDPDAGTSAKILIAIAEAGADLLEVGVPFSDPLADGPVIQRATERALAAGMTLRGTLDVVRAVRRAVETPIVLFTYANPVVRMEPDVFAREAKEAGVDGVLILDLPIEECAYELYRITRQVLEPGWEDFPSRAADAVARRLGW